MLRQPFDDQWYVQRTSAPTTEPAGPLTLPHDAMLFEERSADAPDGPTTGYFPGGTYRYTRTFDAPEAWRGRRVTLEFEGVYTRSVVRLNGQRIGGRASGYAEFHVDLSRALRFDAPNTLEVVADNSRPLSSRWYSGSGIYRPVHLLVGGPARITPHGLRVTTVRLEGGRAVVEVATEIVSDAADRHLSVDVELRSPDGALAAEGSARVRVPAGDTRVLRQLITVDDVTTWSTETPFLYTAAVSLREAGEVVDRAHDDVGLRTVTVDARHGLRVNGQTVKLRGACVHHDNGVIGAHTLDAAEDRRVRLLKASGYNAVRSAHNPASRALLRACDRHGVMVMDELTDVWWRAKTPGDHAAEFEQEWERDLEAMVGHSYNHPSVVMYSIGNEVAETAVPRGVELGDRIAQRCRELDPSRPVTNCISGLYNLLFGGKEETFSMKAMHKDTGDEVAPRAQRGPTLVSIVNTALGTAQKLTGQLTRLPVVDRRTRDSFAVVDVAGYNYLHQRYRADTARHPQRVIVGSETAPSHTAAIWRLVEELPAVIGDFVWAGWDFLGEAGIAAMRYDEPFTANAPWPALTSGLPIIDITGHRQTQSYVNQVIWHQATGPFLAVQPVDRSGQRRFSTNWRPTDSVRSWSWEGLEGRQATVEVYADAHRVELLLDGRPVGSGRIDRDTTFGAFFTIPYEPGVLTAVAYAADGREVGRDTLTSAGDSLQLSVAPESSALTADGADLLYVPIALTDAAGILRPLADRPVTVDVSGAGTLLGLGTGQPITEETFTAGRHTTYRGRALAVVRAGHEPGDVTVEVSAEGCEPVRVVVPSRAPTRA